MMPQKRTTLDKLLHSSNLRCMETNFENTYAHIHTHLNIVFISVKFIQVNVDSAFVLLWFKKKIHSMSLTLFKSAFYHSNIQNKYSYYCPTITISLYLNTLWNKLNSDNIKAEALPELQMLHSYIFAMEINLISNKI